MVTEDTITLIFISNGKSLQTTQTQESRWRRGCVTAGAELLQDFQADTATLTGNPGGWQWQYCVLLSACFSHCPSFAFAKLTTIWL